MTPITDHEIAAFDKRSEEVRLAVDKNKGLMPKDKASRSGYKVDLQAKVLTDMKLVVQQLDSLRTGQAEVAPIDISFADYARDRWGFAVSENGSVESLFIGLGIDPSKARLSYLMAMPEFQEAYRWLVPEIIREAMRLGLRKDPLYPQLIAFEENVPQPKVNMPFINQSDAMPSKIGESETIPTGTLSFGQRDITLQKIGIGIKMTDEVINYVSINLLSLFFGDMGVKLNMAKDVLAINTLINGDGTANTSAPVIGVDTLNSFKYKDLLRAWIRMGILGRLPQSIMSNEAVALDVLMLDEFIKRDIVPAGSREARMLNFRTPIPTTQNYDVHGAMPVANQLMLVDATSALIKFNSQALRLENERIVQRQINGTFATETTGFATLFRDARLIIDKSLAFSSQGYPDWMDAGAVQAAAALRVM